MTRKEMINKKIIEIIAEYQFMEDFFNENKEIIKDRNLSLMENLNMKTEEEFEDIGINKDQFLDQVYEYFKQLKEFVELHAESRMIEDIEGVVNKTITEANKLAGEKFNLDSSITSFSGGQSRALMISDTAILSKSPIVLIDEIENAGIDRKKALKLLLKEEKIVLMATHDPILALTADKRIIIKNGAINNIIETTEEERKMLIKLETIDNYLLSKRQEIRLGKTITDTPININK